MPNFFRYDTELNYRTTLDLKKLFRPIVVQQGNIRISSPLGTAVFSTRIFPDETSVVRVASTASLLGLSNASLAKIERTVSLYSALLQVSYVTVGAAHEPLPRRTAVAVEVATTCPASFHARDCTILRTVALPVGHVMKMFIEPAAGRVR